MSLLWLPLICFVLWDIYAIWPDLIYLFFLHILGWRLSVSINDMLCYVITGSFVYTYVWWLWLQRRLRGRWSATSCDVGVVDDRRTTMLMLTMMSTGLHPSWRWESAAGWDVRCWSAAAGPPLSSLHQFPSLDAACLCHIDVCSDVSPWPWVPSPC